ncbi:prepilin-type N-terminal cleavage/methylation domain-containing protein [Novipirellula caenicola]|uniref:Pseudopilin GspJ n=1 Tax=Novipirellula caenicola TaxID=1536901 RepID=A0ABP9W3R4_9BACT
MNIAPHRTRTSLIALRSTTTSGFTLLEVILTLALSVVLMMLIGGAIQFYADTMNTRDMDVRQVQLATAVLQMIEDDLRSAAHPIPIDTSPLETLLASAATQAVGGGGGGGGEESSGEDLSAAGLADESDMAIDDMAMDTMTDATADLQTGTSVLQTPGLIGNQYQIQIDLSRLPRLEEYSVLMDASTATLDDIPSDLKTVTYFIQDAGAIGGVVDSLQDPNSAVMDSPGGLVRRSLDRAATIYAMESGAITSLNQTGELLAPEIVGIEFSYWDGTIWQIEWSSDEMGELPAAVQVRLTMNDPTIVAANESGLSDESPTRTFTHIVRLPLARPIEVTEDELMETGL